MYRQLIPERIVHTLETLGNRIRERFPDSSLGRVSGELTEFARQTGTRIDRLRRPNWLLRAASLAVVLAIVALIAAAARGRISKSRRKCRFPSCSRGWTPRSTC